MTGYGEGTAESDRFVISTEVRSINNRFLKIVSKVSDEFSFLQNDLENQIRDRLIRGTIYLTVRIEPRDTTDLHEIDQEVLKKYLGSLEQLKTELGVTEEICLRDLLLLPGVVRGEETLVPPKESIAPAAQQAMSDALTALNSMRELEGGHLEKELAQRVRQLGELLDSIEKEAPKAIEEYQQKLDQRLRLFLGEHQASLTTEDILKEVALFAERSDITEEVARMQSHISQFSSSLGNDGPVGRKLEFIVQEMFREANTMGSKSPSSQLSVHVVELKAEVDRIKEQVANIE